MACHNLHVHAIIMRLFQSPHLPIVRNALIWSKCQCDMDSLEYLASGVMDHDPFIACLLSDGRRLIIFSDLYIFEERTFVIQ